MDLWVQTSFELAQWENIQEYGKQAENFDLLAQSLAKTQDWTILREDVLTAIKASSQFWLAQHQLFTAPLNVEILRF